MQKYTRFLLFIILLFSQIGANFGPFLSKRQSSQKYQVRFHPDGVLYVGDLISIEVTAPAGVDVQNNRLQVWIDGAVQPLAVHGEFYLDSYLNVYRLVLQWAWDTQNISPGYHILRFQVFPHNDQWEMSVFLLPAEERPETRQNSHWAEKTINCCILNYLTGTKAERELSQIAQIVDTTAEEIGLALGEKPATKIPIEIIPRILGQGGFTTNEIYITYTDGDYSSGNFSQVIRHELVHYIDQESSPGDRPLILMEGLAVYLAGGHYKREPFIAQTSALLATGDYIPLTSLVNHFYNHQHEAGYLEAGALTAYLIDRWGWSDYLNFYHSILLEGSQTDADVIDAGLQNQFHLSLDYVEKDFMTWLENMPVLPELQQDVILSMHYYDDVRLYQQQYDPSAYFYSVWLPDAREMQRRGIVADYLRTPDSPAAERVRSILGSAGTDLSVGDYYAASRELGLIDSAMDQTAKKSK